MRDHCGAEHAVGFLLRLVGDETADRVRARIGLPGPEHPSVVRRRLQRPWMWSGELPSSVLLWVLEQDDPELNALIWPYIPTDSGLRRAVARGVPFGPGRTEAVPVDDRLKDQESVVPTSYVHHGLVGALRAVGGMRAARRAASMVLTRSDWRTVTEADHERPLPGFARWALAVRPDCPPALRTQFGSHRKFTHRLCQAGVLDGPAEYATSYGPAASVLQVLSLGHVLFPARVQEAAEALRPCVHDHLGDREEAWAVLARLVGRHHGNVPQLVLAAGALA
ncbi:hypothetical protein [Streptomyces brasiliensis]|uniref:Uncharacterized protein n=1 Tax=Streptomyces brasiliensis TaxID=1954 RepID=A0A917L5J9_9ACTN|nr:hypothetical protein [Streptomyces brasiliensis]GGJ45710.1 hypothetical protein GCM10010121_066200 [Streptomyces brasiliensis]